MLDEDEWTEQLEAIIERDYFPDKAKLENKLEWLQVLPALQVAGGCVASAILTCSVLADRS